MSGTASPGQGGTRTASPGSWLPCTGPRLRSPTWIHFPTQNPGSQPNTPPRVNRSPFSHRRACGHAGPGLPAPPAALGAQGDAGGAAATLGGPQAAPPARPHTHLPQPPPRHIQLSPTLGATARPLPLIGHTGRMAESGWLLTCQSPRWPIEAPLGVKAPTRNTCAAERSAGCWRRG